jgi:hypothetical protein
MNQVATEERPPVSSVVTVSDNIQSTLARHRGALEYAREAYPVIETVEVANDCSIHLKALKHAEDEVATAKAELLDPVKRWIEKWISPTHDSIKLAIEHCNTALLAFKKREDERVARERREAEEADRKARAEAQARAAAEEARARQAAEQKRREEEEAERKRKAAEEEGNKREALKQAALVARLREEAAAREEAGRQEADRIRQEAAAIAPTEVRQAEKVTGFSTRKNWKAKLGPNTTEDNAILKIAAGIFGLEIKDRNPGEKLSLEFCYDARPELIAMLKIDWTAANKTAKAHEANFNVPGLEAWNDIGGASR